MIGFFYDDFLHIGEACYRLDTAPGHRLLLSFFHCYVGTSPLIIRFFSLSCIFLSIYFLSKLLKKNDIKIDKYFYLLISLHSVILFPFFYTSQISTAATFLWSLGTTYALLYFPNFILLTFCLGIGHILRFESIYLLIICITYAAVLRFSIKSNIINPLQVFNKKQYLTSTSFIALFFVIGEVLNVLINTYKAPSNVLSVYAGNVPDYPSSSHIFVQFYAIFLYFKNLLLPFDADFFYPWSHWLNIHNSLNLKILLTASFSIISGLSFLFFLKLRKNNKLWRYPLIGLVVFLVVCLTLSIRSRVDWYFQSRQYIATYFFLTFLYLSIQKYLSSNKKISFSILGFLILSTVLQITIHYSDILSFSIWEFSKYENSSPNAINFYSSYVATPEERQRLYQKSHIMTNTPLIYKSAAARKHWLQSLVYGYAASIEVHDRKSQIAISNIIMKSESYYATVVCLAEESIPIDKCLEGGRKNNFCITIHKRKGVAHEIIKPRLPIESICN